MKDIIFKWMDEEKRKAKYCTLKTLIDGYNDDTAYPLEGEDIPNEHDVKNMVIRVIE